MAKRRIRPNSAAQADIAAKLMRDGWNVEKRGWPTFLATKGNSLRLIVVNGSNAQVLLSPPQRRIAAAFRKVGIEVEVIRSARSGPFKKSKAALAELEVS